MKINLLPSPKLVKALPAPRPQCKGLETKGLDDHIDDLREYMRYIAQSMGIPERYFGNTQNSITTQLEMNTDYIESLINGN